MSLCTESKKAVSQTFGNNVKILSKRADAFPASFSVVRIRALSPRTSHAHAHPPRSRATIKRYGGFPASSCISINDEVIHGIPSGRIIQEGDVVSVDVGAAINGYTGDNAATFAAGTVSEEAQKIMDVTKECLYRAIEAAQPGNRLGDIGFAVESYAKSFGFAVVRDYVGHGVGAQMHEAPEVPNYGQPGHGPRLMAGMTLAVEPMVNVGDWQVKVLRDGWTVKTRDGSLAAHYENSILITEGDPEILTVCED